MLLHFNQKQLKFTKGHVLYNIILSSNKVNYLKNVFILILEVKNL